MWVLWQSDSNSGRNASIDPFFQLGCTCKRMSLGHSTQVFVPSVSWNSEAIHASFASFRPQGCFATHVCTCYFGIDHINLPSVPSGARNAAVSRWTRALQQSLWRCGCNEESVLVVGRSVDQSVSHAFIWWTWWLYHIVVSWLIWFYLLLRGIAPAKPDAVAFCAFISFVFFMTAWPGCFKLIRKPVQEPSEHFQANSRSIL